jgi:hypothetical protein
LKLGNRIDYESDAHAIVERGRVVLIDPLRLEEAALRRIGTVEAIEPFTEVMELISGNFKFLTQVATSAERS